MATKERPDDVRAWLAGQPPLKELREAYPGEWATVQAELAEVVATGDLDRLKRYVLTSADERPAANRAERRRRGQTEDPAAAEVRQAMRAAALKKICLSAATGVTEGKVRFNLVNGWIAQRLLFKRGLERKPVSLPAFNLLWPLLPQRNFLMPLVEPKGIYCFYSRKLVKQIAQEIGDRKALEIAAGDGTLTRFLQAEGVDITATDDHSWDHSVSYPDNVLNQDAKTALQEHEPQVVICSWPPAGNPFEHNVFATPTVELYIVIASQHAFAAGNWADYERAAQADFSFAEDPELSKLVLPPELESAVYVFRR